MATSAWDNFISGVDRVAKKVECKADRLSEGAALRLKLAATRADLEEAFATFGQLAYRRSFDPSVEPDELALLDQQLEAAVAHIDALRESIRSLESKIER